MKDFDDDPHLDVCQNIEAGLMQSYRSNARLTDVVCELALDNAKIAIKQHFGFAQNERVSQSDAVAPIVAFCVQIGQARIGKINDLTLKEFVARIDKVKASVRRHSHDGPRAYFAFVSPFFPEGVTLIGSALST